MKMPKKLQDNLLVNLKPQETQNIFEFNIFFIVLIYCIKSYFLYLYLLNR